ncbi:MAG: hypothetical protein KUG79_17985 [Pseudomonadales bacterium]|nr:hypothetical protein [Pseudomonadales bacterium]
MDTNENLYWSPLLWLRNSGLHYQYELYSLSRKVKQLRVLYLLFAAFSIANVITQWLGGMPNLIIFNSFLFAITVGGYWHIRKDINPQQLTMNANIIGAIFMSAVLAVKTTLPSSDWSILTVDLLIIMVLTVASPLNLLIKAACALVLITLDAWMMFTAPEFYTLTQAVSLSLALLGAASFAQFAAYQTESAHFLAFQRLNSIKLLKGMLPICANCKDIRDENGQYQRMEQYITLHSEASFSHGICPKCMVKLYPEFQPID